MDHLRKQFEPEDYRHHDMTMGGPTSIDLISSVSYWCLLLKVNHLFVELCLHPLLPVNRILVLAVWKFVIDAVKGLDLRMFSRRHDCVTPHQMHPQAITQVITVCFKSRIDLD